MDGMRNVYTGVVLFIGKLPGRKQECFYFVEDNVIIPVAYINDRYLVETKKLWGKLTAKLPNKEV